MSGLERRARSVVLAVLAIAAAFAGGLFVGYVDLTSAEVQGPALILMAVSFFCALPRFAPGWATALAAAAGLPFMHWLGSLIDLQGAAPNAGMIVAVIPALIATYVGVAIRIVVDAAVEALPRAAGERSVAAEGRITRIAIVFAGLAACAAMGLPGASTVLLIQSGLHRGNQWWLAGIWQLVSLTGWCALAVVVIRRYATRARTHTELTLARVLRHAVLVTAAAMIHTAGLLLVTRLLFVPLSSSALAGGDTALTSYVFLTYLPLDALAYMTIMLLAYSTDRERIAREAARRDAELQAALDQARLAALDAQLRPHFLFNALNSVVVLARRGDADGAASAAEALADLTRYVLRDRPEDGTVTVDEEMEFARTYLELERIRFSDRLETEVLCDVDAAAARVPRLILQPLVENAIRHGTSRRVEAGRIAVRARIERGELELSVEDDGPGVDPTAADGLGLRATRARLEATHAARAALDLRRVTPHGTRASVRMPIVT
jgi:signal transduction histidine kinase